MSFKWQGFTLQWYREWNGIPGLITGLHEHADHRLLRVATVAAVIGTLLALALVRYRFRGKAATDRSCS